MKRLKTGSGMGILSIRALSADRGQFEVFTPSIPARKHDRYSVRPARCRPVGTLYIGAAATQLSY